MSDIIPKRHHIDRRAGDLLLETAADALAHAGCSYDPDELLSTAAVSEWLSLSMQWLEIGRHRGYGPRYCKLSPRRVRYRRADVLTWLAERTYQATAEYATPGKDVGDDAA
jgi:predicted DNA-binding transcriptional regulator AlpA